MIEFSAIVLPPQGIVVGPNRAIHEANRQSWNAATRAHNTHKTEQIPFFRQGGTTLFEEERRLLGDLTGVRVAHLMCNAGQDTLGLVQLGAASVIGVDISDVAITAAEELTAAVGAPATFVRADVYDWLDDAVKRGEE